MSSVRRGGVIGCGVTCFSPDACRFATAIGSRVKVCNVETSLCELALVGHTGHVVAVRWNPFNPLQIITADSNGLICIWDSDDGALLSTHETGLQLVSLHPNPSNDSSYIVVAFVPKHARAPDRASSSSPPTPSRRGGSRAHPEVTGKASPRGKQHERPASPVSASKVPLGYALGVLCVEQESQHDIPVCSFQAVHWQRSRIHMTTSFAHKLVATCNGKKVTVLGATRQELYEVATWKHRSSVSALAFHPHKATLAVGDAGGRIFSLHLGPAMRVRTQLEQQQAQRKRLRAKADDVPKPVHGAVAVAATAKLGAPAKVGHWHSKRIRCMVYTADGAYLLSGSSESVLVIWQLSTGKRNFLPRLGGCAIVDLVASPDHKWYALVTSDNCVRIVNAVDVTLHHSVQSLFHNASQGAPATGLVVEPRHGQVVMNALPHSLQTFCLVRDRVVRTLDIAPSAALHAPSDVAVIPTQVAFVCFSRTGESMVTLDCRTSKGVYQSSLKFWLYDASRGTYTLNTQADDPHPSTVTGVAYHPKEDLVVTTSVHGSIKTWHRMEQQSKSKPPMLKQRSSRQKSAASRKQRVTLWSCSSSSSWHNSPAHAVAFSHDGSVLAVACGSAVTLWDPLTNVVRLVLAYSCPSQHIRALMFTGMGSTCLVGHTSTTLYVWNVLSGTLVWQLDLSVSSMCADPWSTRFAVATHAPRASEPDTVTPLVMIWSDEAPRPTQLWRPQGRHVYALAWTPLRGVPDVNREDGTAGEQEEEEEEEGVKGTTGDGKTVTHVGNAFAQLVALCDASEVQVLPVDGGTPAPLTTDAMKDSVRGKKGDVHQTPAQVALQLAESERREAAEATEVAVPTATAQAEEASFLGDTPTHVLPPLESLCASFLGSFVAKAAPVDDDTTQGAAVGGVSSEEEEEEAHVLAPTGDAGSANRLRLNTLQSLFTSVSISQ